MVSLAGVSRRRILEISCLGFGSIALADLLHRSPLRAAETAPDKGVPIFGDLRARPGHFPAQAKAVIQLVQNGGPSQMDLFDPKPELTKRAGQPHPDGVEIHQPNNENILLPSPFEFRNTGSAAWTSPKCCRTCGTIVDELVLHAVHAHRAQQSPGRSEHAADMQDLSRAAGDGRMDQLRSRDRESESAGVCRAARSERLHHRRQAALGQRLSAGALSGCRVQYAGRAGASSESGNSRCLPACSGKVWTFWQSSTSSICRSIRSNPSSKRASRISSWRRACSSPLPTFWTSPKRRKRPRSFTVWTIPLTASYGTRCLMARRLVEAGVRFVQVTTSPGQPWDHHNKIKQGHPEDRDGNGSGRRRSGEGSEEPRLARQHDRDVGGRVRTSSHDAERRRPRPQPQRLHDLVRRRRLQEGLDLRRDGRFRIQVRGRIVSACRI